MAAPSFDFTAGVLTITTDIMVMKFKRGAVIHLQNVSTSEYYIYNTDLNVNPPASTWLQWLGLTIATSNLSSWNNFRPNADAADVSTSNPDSYTYIVTYINCLDTSDVETSGATIEYTFTVDSTTAEISISVSAEYPSSLTTYNSYVFDIMLMNLGYTGSSACDLIFQARKIAWADADELWDRDTQSGPQAGSTGFYNSPPLYIAEVTNSCLGVWCEDTNIVPNQIMGNHEQNSYNHLFLKGYQTPAQVVADKYTVSSGPWRFTVQSTWLAIAKRWRARYNTLWPDATYLWNRSPSWTQSVHCRYASLQDSTGLDDVMAAGIAAANFVYDGPALDYNGNGDFQPLFGDITKANALTKRRPTDAEITKLAALGIKCLCYFFHYSLHNSNGIQTRLDAVAAFLQAGWDNDPLDYDPFHPDYSGYNPAWDGPTQETNWMNYWDSNSSALDTVSTGYNRIHLGSTKAQDTWYQIMRDFCDATNGYNFAGMFWDELWGDHNGLFTDGTRIQNGMDFLQGAQYAAKTIQAGGLVVLGEYFSHHFAPYVWYTWEGPRTWVALRQELGYSRIAIDHPLLQALVGSYTWHTDQKISNNIHPDGPINIDEYNHEDFAYMGCIPQFCISSDYYGPTFGNGYYTARAKMFCDYDMFYDLPDSWGDVTEELAYYRTNTTTMIKLVKRATGRYAYVSVGNGDYALQHELKTGENTGHKIFSDTYTSIPTIEVSAGCSYDNVTLTGFDFTDSGTSGSWLVFGEQDILGFRKIYIGGLQCNLTVI